MPHAGPQLSPPPESSHDDALSIDAATVASCGALSTLHALCFDDPWSDRFLASILHLPGSFGLIARRNGAPVGMAVVRCALDEAELLTIGVTPEARGGGVGTRLLADVLDGVRGRGGVRVFLDVAVTNLAARRLYDAAGFVEVGRRPDYYRSGDDALALACELSPL